MTDKCENCNKKIPSWLRVCSSACAGAMGGKKKVPKGFALNRELARTAGKTGGTISRRGKHE